MQGTATPKENAMKNVKLGTKLIGGFVVTATIALLIGLLAIYEMRGLTGHIRTIGENAMPSVQALLEIESEMINVQKSMRTLMSPYISSRDRASEVKAIEEARERYRRSYDAYDKMEKSADEAQLWKEFEALVRNTVDTNNQVIQGSKQVLESDILNPMQLMSDLQTFRGDHWKLNTETANLIMNGANFEGGTDPRACAFGRWAAQFQTKNPRLNDHLQKIHVNHDRFHAAVAEIKQAIAAGDRNRAATTYTSVMLPAAESTFTHLREMRAIVTETDKAFNEMVTRPERRKPENECRPRTGRQARGPQRRDGVEAVAEAQAEARSATSRPSPA
jgi:methyl-accepting chemotaxis protein